MVRRWSRINTFNKPTFLTSQVFLAVTSRFNINSTRSTTLKTSQFSCLYRTKWARRKHLVGWLFLTFVLSFWCQEYYFYKHLSNFLFIFKFYRFNFGLFNFLPLKHLPSSIDLSSQSLKLGFLGYQIKRFYQKYLQLNAQKLLATSKNFTYASSYKTSLNSDPKKLLNLWVIFGGGNQILKYNELNNLTILNQDKNFYFIYLRMYIMILTAYYKTLIYLIYTVL